MMKSQPQSPDSKGIAAMRNERVRMQAEVVEVIAGAHRTVARSRALLTEVEAILAREKLPPVTPGSSKPKATVR